MRTVVKCSARNAMRLRFPSQQAARFDGTRLIKRQVAPNGAKVATDEKQVIVNPGSVGLNVNGFEGMRSQAEYRRRLAPHPGVEVGSVVTRIKSGTRLV